MAALEPPVGPTGGELVFGEEHPPAGHQQELLGIQPCCGIQEGAFMVGIEVLAVARRPGQLVHMTNGEVTSGEGLTGTFMITGQAGGTHHPGRVRLRDPALMGQP